MSLNDLRLRNRSTGRFRFEFITPDSVGSLSLYGVNSSSLRCPAFPFRKTLSGWPEEIVTFTQPNVP